MIAWTRYNNTKRVNLKKMLIIQFHKEEQQKYLEYSINTNEVQVKKEWANYFNKYAKSEIL